jgi:DNA-binding protein H-NS
MQSLDEIQTQIAHLQAQADQMKREQRAEALEIVRKHIRAYDLTAEDCGFEAPKAKGKAKATKVKAVKDTSTGYRGPNGEHWKGGKGPRPLWVKAIMEAGEDLETYRVA